MRLRHSVSERSDLAIMFLPYSLSIISLPGLLALSSIPLSPALTLFRNHTSPPHLQFPTSTTSSLNNWPAVPFTLLIYGNFYLCVSRIQPHEPLVAPWTAETALLDIATQISLHDNPGNRLPLFDSFHSDNGEVDISVEFTAQGARTVTYGQARRIVDLLLEIVQAYGPRQIEQADIMFGKVVFSHSKMSFAASAVVGKGEKVGGTARAIE